MVYRFKLINLEVKYKNIVDIIARRLQKSAPGKDQSFREPLIHARSLSGLSVFCQEPSWDRSGALALWLVLIVQICGESQTNVDDPSKQ